MRRTLALTAALFIITTGSAFAVVGGGDLTLKGGKGGNITFSHDIHVGVAGLDCKACHPGLYLDVKRHKKVGMKQMQQGKSCGACHNGKKAFSVKGQCSKCHKN